MRGIGHVELISIRECGIIRPSKLESLYEYVVFQINCAFSGTNIFQGVGMVSKEAGSYKCLGHDKMKTITSWVPNSILISHRISGNVLPCLGVLSYANKNHSAL